MIKGLEHLLYEEMLKEKAQGGSLPYLKGRCRKDRDRFSSVVPNDRTRGSRHKLKHRWHPLKRRHFFLL